MFLSTLHNAAFPFQESARYANRPFGGGGLSLL
jgi:hypothetical protein